MLAYGYPWQGERETPDLLREASLVCSWQELDTLIAFLQELRDNGQDGDHRHYRDQDGGWDETHSDFILFLTHANEVWTKGDQG